MSKVIKSFSGDTPEALKRVSDIYAGSSIKGATVNFLGLTFKENGLGLRNSQMPDITQELESYGVEVCCMIQSPSPLKPDVSME